MFCEIQVITIIIQTLHVSLDRLVRIKSLAFSRSSISSTMGWPINKHPTSPSLSPHSVPP